MTKRRTHSHIHTFVHDTSEMVPTIDSRTENEQKKLEKWISAEIFVLYLNT